MMLKFARPILTIYSRVAATAVLVLSSYTDFAQVAKTPTCPIQIDSIKMGSSVAGIGTFGAHADTAGKLSFRYNNLSGRDVRSITLRIIGRMQVSGPTGPSFVDTSQTVVVDGPMLANTSKKTKVKLPNGSLSALRVELAEVKFTDGDLWENDEKLHCVVNVSNGKRRQ